MKRGLTIIAATMAILQAFGQGQVNFNNRNTAVTPNVVAPIYWESVGGNLASGTGYRVALLGGSTSLTPAFIPFSRTNGGFGPSTAGTLNLLTSPSTSATWATFRTGTVAGFAAVGTDSARDSGLPYGSTGLFQVVAWSGQFNTWIEAYNAAIADPFVGVGASNPLILPVTLNPTDLNVPALIGLESFAIVPFIPEPSSFALAGLSAAALLSFGRRKQSSGGEPRNR
jgi:hypothetical protein